MQIEELDNFQPWPGKWVTLPTHLLLILNNTVVEKKTAANCTITQNGGTQAWEAGVVANSYKLVNCNRQRTATSNYIEGPM